MSQIGRKPLEKVFAVNDLELAALSWRVSPVSGSSETNTPLLCLHGWLDNAAGFLSLAPHIGANEILAVDMAGHGRSSHRSLHGSYNIWDDLQDLVAVIKAQGWERVNLLGHSRGGFVAILLAACAPELVERAVLLDAFLPEPEESSFTEQMGKYLRDRDRFIGRQRSIYNSVDAAVEHRCKATALSAEELRPLVERDLKAVDGGVAWSHDPRLHGASAVKLIQPHLDDILQTLDRPVNIIGAEQGLIAAYRDQGGVSPVENHPCFEEFFHPGKHHFHMEQQQLVTLAAMINQQLDYSSATEAEAK